MQSGGWTARNLPTLGERFVGFNMNDPVVGGARGLPIRRAIAAAVDREALVRAVYDGIYIPQTGLVPPVLAGWNEDAPAQDYDPARAAALYEAAGSPPLQLVCWSELREAMATAEWLQSSCAAAGIPLTLRPMTLERIGALWGTPRMPAMFLTGWLADYPAADNFLFDLFYSSMSASSAGTSYSNEDVDRLLALARSTSDVRRHEDLNHRAAAQIMADLPVVPLIEFADYRLTSERVGGFSADPMGFVDMSRLWVR